MPEAPNTPFQDDFVDKDFQTLDLRGSSGASLRNELTQIAREDPQFTPAPPAPSDGLPPEPAIDVPAAAEPQVMALEDGSTVTVEQTTRGFKATLEGNTGAPAEVFYGATEQQMWMNVAAGKLNATKKIRQLNRQVKLAKQAPASEPQQPAAAPAPQPQTALNADDVFKIKTKLADNPDLALEEWFQKRTGLSVNELVKLAHEGREAKTLLAEREAVAAIGEIATEFVEATPLYFADPQNRNVTALVGWLAKHKLHQSHIADIEATMGALYQGGHWTVESLSEAYEDLSESGLLLTRPAAPRANPPADPAPAPAAPAVTAQPAAQPNDERIARVERQPRAGLGIRPRETTSRVAPAAEQPPSVEAIDDMSTEDVNQLFAGVRRERLKSTRR